MKVIHGCPVQFKFLNARCSNDVHCLCILKSQNIQICQITTKWLNFSFYILGASLFVPGCTDVVMQADLSLNGLLQTGFFFCFLFLLKMRLTDFSNRTGVGIMHPIGSVRERKCGRNDRMCLFSDSPFHMMTSSDEATFLSSFCTHTCLSSPGVTPTRVFTLKLKVQITEGTYGLSCLFPLSLPLQSVTGAIVVTMLWLKPSPSVAFNSVIWVCSHSAEADSDCLVLSQVRFKAKKKKKKPHSESLRVNVSSVTDAVN